MSPVAGRRIFVSPRANGVRYQKGLIAMDDLGTTPFDPINVPDFGLLLDGLEKDPLRGLSAYFAALAPLPYALEHQGLDILGWYLVQSGNFLDVAEAVARRLNGEDEDQYHSELLASVLRAKGHLAEAEVVLKKSRDLPDHHGQAPSTRAWKR
jgi:hypothetical protein